MSGFGELGVFWLLWLVQLRRRVLGKLFRQLNITLNERKLIMALNPDSEQHKGNLVVRIDEDSDSDLQALFDSVLKPDSKRPLQVPLRMRKLPNSFFNPPSTGSKSPSVSSISHSRENSADSAFGTASVGAGAGGTTTSATGASGLQVNHPRAHSSPASLQQTYASAQQQQHGHLKQRSYDITTVDELGPLPPGWEQARTPEGQVYYLKWVFFILSAGLRGCQHKSWPWFYINSLKTKPKPLWLLPVGAVRRMTKCCGVVCQVYILQHAYIKTKTHVKLTFLPSASLYLKECFVCKFLDFACWCFW